MSSIQFLCLKWDNYLHHITSAFDSLRDEDEFLDCTLSCEGKRIKAHKMLLSACSTYFMEIFKENPCQHPVIILEGVSYIHLESLINFMYNGQVSVNREHLHSFMRTAELLHVHGLTDETDKNTIHQRTSSNTVSQTPMTGTSSTDSINEPAFSPSPTFTSDSVNNTSFKTDTDSVVNRTSTPLNSQNTHIPFIRIPVPETAPKRKCTIPVKYNSASSQSPRSMKGAGSVTSGDLIELIDLESSNMKIECSSYESAGESVNEQDLSFGKNVQADGRHATGIMNSKLPWQLMIEPAEGIFEQSMNSDLSAASERMSPNDYEAMDSGFEMTNEVMPPNVTRGKTVRYRTVFTLDQQLKLEKEFRRNSFVANREHRHLISKELGLTDRQVKIWFQNRRMKAKKERREEREMAASVKRNLEMKRNVIQSFAESK